MLNVIAAPTSTRADDVARILPEDWIELFERYRRLVVHYALLAELSGAELFSIGTELDKATNFEALAGDPRKREIKRAAWEGLFANAHALFDGTVVLTASDRLQLAREVYGNDQELLAARSFPWRSEPSQQGHVLEGQVRYGLSILREVAEEKGLPLVLLPTGFPACEQAEVRGRVLVPRVDEAAQERLHAALANVLAQEAWGQAWFGGLFVWFVAPEEESFAPWGFQVFGNAAEAQLARVFGR